MTLSDDHAQKDLGVEEYDPLQSPDPAIWLDRDEDQRHALVLAYHLENEGDVFDLDNDDEGPNTTLHATIQVVVENQLALGDETVLITMDRLLRQGLDRHDALHAIGAVLFEVIRAERPQEDMRRYYRRLRKLTARRWRKGTY